MKRFTHILAATGSLAILLPAGADVYTFRTVAMTGDPAPGSFNGVFTEFGPPSINKDGLVAFAAKTNAASVTSGMWMTPANAPNTVGFVAGKDWPVPNSPGVTFGNFLMGATHGPRINDLGNVGFNAPLQGLADASASGLFRRINGTVQKVYIPGDAAPGLPGVTFKQLGSGASFNNNNLVALHAYLQGAGITDPFHGAQYLDWFGGLTMVTQEGAPAPGLPGVTMGYTYTFRTQVNDSGRIAFQCTLEGGSQTSSVWTGWPGALTLLATNGQMSPAGFQFNGANSNIGGSLTKDGMCFTYDIYNGQNSLRGLWNYNGQSTQSIAYESGPGPIGSYATLYVDSAMAAGDGTMAFRARFNQPVTVDTAIVRKSPGKAPTVVVREGDPPYGWGGLEFDDFGDQTKTIIDDTGRVYIIAKVRGPGVNPSNDEGMWVREPNGEWHLVTRRGLSMTLKDGVARQVSTFAVTPGDGMHTGYRPGVNNNGDIAMRVTFTDGVSAIVVAELPTCIGDLNKDGTVGVADLLMLLAAWGPCPNCAADLNKDNVVGVADLLILLANWGPCP